MTLWSISFSYRLGLGFHALNNEGADGSNLMQPRRIDVGRVTYDGISGEIIRRHILQNFVDLCREGGIATYPLSEALHPDRGPIGIRRAAKDLGRELKNESLLESVRKAIQSCALLDVGGYLAAWQDAASQVYVAEKPYIDSYCAELPKKGNKVDLEPVKRDSCFDVGWLISEEPQDLTVTQHSAFRDTFSLNSRYAQTMRSNVYAGVIRAELHRVGMDDYWYLQNGPNGQAVNRLAIATNDQAKRQRALIEAIARFIAAPTGAKVAGWAPHVFLCEGAILLTASPAAPFVSPIKVTVANESKPITANDKYREEMLALKKRDGDMAATFTNAAELADSVQTLVDRIPIPEAGPTKGANG
jgi:CRISPR-associated autoregulator DevR family